jgi:hypothetical protein
MYSGGKSPGAGDDDLYGLLTLLEVRVWPSSDAWRESRALTCEWRMRPRQVHWHVESVHQRVRRLSSGSVMRGRGLSVGVYRRGQLILWF